MKSQYILNSNQTARIKAKPWMFQLSFEVYEAVFALKSNEFIEKKEQAITKKMNFFKLPHAN